MQRHHRSQGITTIRGRSGEDLAPEQNQEGESDCRGLTHHQSQVWDVQRQFFRIANSEPEELS